MKLEQWRKIEDILDKALQFDNSQQRAIFIEKACRGDRALYIEVQLLMRAIKDAERIGFLE